MRNLKIMTIMAVMIFIVIFEWRNLVYSEVLEKSSEIEIPLYIKEHFKNIKDYYIANNFVFTVSGRYMVVLFGEFKNPNKKEKEKNYERVLTRPLAIIIFDGILQEEKDLKDILRSRMEALDYGYSENIKNIYLYGDDVSISWSEKTNMIKAEIKCVCGCAVGLFSKDICFHKNCSMKK